MTRAAEVIRRRLARRDELIALAREVVARLDPALGLRGAVVFGSVARGDFHSGSDVDLLLIAEHLPARPGERLEAVGWPYPEAVSPVVWTPQEYRRRRLRPEPITAEVDRHGVWLVGDPEALERDS